MDAFECYLGLVSQSPGESVWLGGDAFPVLHPAARLTSQSSHW